MSSGRKESSEGRHGIVAMTAYLHVADVEASAAFYGILGFEVVSRHASSSGHTVWAHVASGAARLMLAQASGPIDASQQAILLYAHANNVAELRARAIAVGVHDGRAYEGQPGPNRGRRVVFEVSYPFYMPGGELRLHDPDGYVILIGQLT